MLSRWLDACIVCAKPNGKDAYFGQVRFIILRDTLLETIRCFAITSILSGRNYLFEHLEAPFSIVAR
jgi:hypothetical protein